MFTGLVEAVGQVEDVAPFEKGVRFRIASALGNELSEGESIAVDGVCLTAFDASGDGFTVEAIRTTLSRTTLAEFRIGRAVNLERAIRAGEPLGGHLVQGHVDATATMVEAERTGETVFLRFRLSDAVRRLTVLYGSIALDGISLTVNRLEEDLAEVAIIPYTWSHTNVDRLGRGSLVNVEADMIGKYVDRLLSPYRDAGAAASVAGDTGSQPGEHS
jgi:riboflavin synthase